MPIVFTSRAFRSHQRRGKLHLRIASAERDRFAHPFITVDLHGKIRTRRISGRLQPIRVLTQPARLPIALHQISEIKRRQRILRILPSPPFQPKQELFRDRRTLLRVQRRSPQRFHPHQHRSARHQQRQRVRHQMAHVVIL